MKKPKKDKSVGKKMYNIVQDYSEYSTVQVRSRVARFVLVQHAKTGKLYQMIIKYT
jgi:hypothetical protein